MAVSRGESAEAEKAGEDQRGCSEILGEHGHGWALGKDDRRDGEEKVPSERQALMLLPGQFLWKKCPHKDPRLRPQPCIGPAQQMTRKPGSLRPARREEPAQSDLSLNWASSLVPRQHSELHLAVRSRVRREAHTGLPRRL